MLNARQANYIVGGGMAVNIRGFLSISTADFSLAIGLFQTSVTP